jgi:hypothetical protein
MYVCGYVCVCVSVPVYIHTHTGFSNTEAITLDCIFVHTVPLLANAAQCRPVLEITCNGREVLMCC